MQPEPFFSLDLLVRIGPESGLSVVKNEYTFDFLEYYWEQGYFSFITASIGRLESASGRGK